MDKSKEKIAAVKAAGLTKGDKGAKEKPSATNGDEEKPSATNGGEEKPPAKPKVTKISADPFAGTDGDFEKSADYDMWSDDEEEFDVGGPSHPNVPKGVKSSKELGNPPQPKDFEGDMDKYLDALKICNKFSNENKFLQVFIN